MEDSPAEKRCAVWTLALASLVVLAGQVFHRPNALRDLATGAFPADARLAYPALYLIFAPFFQMADHWTILGLNQHFALLAELNLICLVLCMFRLRRRGV